MASKPLTDDEIIKSFRDGLAVAYRCAYTGHFVDSPPIEVVVGGIRRLVCSQICRNFIEGIAADPEMEFAKQPKGVM